MGIFCALLSSGKSGAMVKSTSHGSVNLFNVDKNLVWEGELGVGEKKNSFFFSFDLKLTPNAAWKKEKL